MVQRSRNSLQYFSAFGDFVLNVASVIITYVLVYRSFKFELSKYAIVAVCGLTLLATGVYFMFDIYSGKRWEKLSASLRKMAIAQAFVMAVCVIAVAILTERSTRYYIWAVSAGSVSYLFLAVKNITITKILHRLRIKNKGSKTVLIVGNAKSAIEYAKQLNDNLHFGYKIIGCVSDAENTRFKKLGGYKELDAIIKEYQPHDVVIAFEAKDEPKIQKIVATCDKNGIRASIIPNIYRYFKAKCQVDMVGNIPVINTRAIPLDNQANAVLKRILDIVISSIAIILTSPIMIVAAIGVKLSSKGPVIFKQKRVGRDNKEFTMYKFRSMTVNEMSDTAWTTPTDSRKTRFGTLMRKTGIDELPQFFNVLFGSMSIVGPRPELPVFVEEYSQTIPLYMVKHQVKPGITGLAQIYGYRGDTSIEKRIELDIKYIETWTLFNDLKIIFLTPFKMFNRNEKYIK